jgi:hypothetical protein
VETVTVVGEAPGRRSKNSNGVAIVLGQAIHGNRAGCETVESGTGYPDLDTNGMESDEVFGTHTQSIALESFDRY